MSSDDGLSNYIVGRSDVSGGTSPFIKKSKDIKVAEPKDSGFELDSKAIVLSSLRKLRKLYRPLPKVQSPKGTVLDYHKRNESAREKQNLFSERSILENTVVRYINGLTFHIYFPLSTTEVVAISACHWDVQISAEWT